MELERRMRRAASRGWQKSSLSALPPRQEAQQHRIQPFVGPHQLVIDVGLSATAAHLGQERLKLGQVAALDLAGVHLELTLVFHREEQGQIIERKSELRRIEQVEDRYVVLSRAQLQQSFERLGPIVEKIGEDHDQRTSGCDFG